MKHGEQHEQKRKKKTKTMIKPDLGNGETGIHDISNQLGAQQPVSAEDPVVAPTFRPSTAKRTRQKTANIVMPSGAGTKLRALQAGSMEDTISDTEAARRARVETPNAAQTSDFGLEQDTHGTELVVPEDLPAVVNKDIATESYIEPEWHQIKHLPGYLRSPIRALGRQVFGTFTETPIERIQVLADLGGRGPNSSREINVVARWLLKHGDKDYHSVMIFERSIPGYDAEIVMYRARGYTFLLVRDFAGKYVYAWPSNDELTAGDNHQKIIGGNG